MAVLPRLHRALIDIASTMNRPEQDAVMLEAAGLSLERALFPLLVLVERLGPIGVVELASRVGRDYTTVSRQVARLEELGLVTRRPGSVDRRVREAEITPEGKTATDAVDAARAKMALALFSDWNRTDIDDLVRLLTRLAEAMASGIHTRAADSLPSKGPGDLDADNPEHHSLTDTAEVHPPPDGKRARRVGKSRR